MAWIHNHRQHRDEIMSLLGEEFWRQRYFWLVASQAAFELGDLNLTQYVFTNGKPKYGTWPWDRSGFIATSAD
jgi:hypothetical protein